MAGRYAETSDVSSLQALQGSEAIVEDVPSGRAHILEGEQQQKGIKAAHSMRVTLGSEGSWPATLSKDFDLKRKRESFDDGLTGSIEVTQSTPSFTKAATQQTFPWDLCEESSLEGTVFLHITASVSSSSSSADEKMMGEFLRGSADRLLPEIATAVVQQAIHLHPPPHNPTASLRIPIRFALVVPKGMGIEDKQTESFLLHLVPRLSDSLKLARRSHVHRFVPKTSSSSSGMKLWVYELTIHQDSLSSLFAGMLSTLEPPKVVGSRGPRTPSASPRALPSLATKAPSPSASVPLAQATPPTGAALKGTVTIPAAFRKPDASSPPTTSPAVKPLPLSGSRIKPPQPNSPSVVTKPPPSNNNNGGRTATPPPSLDPHRPAFFDLKDPIQLDHLRALHASGAIRDYYDTIVQQMEGILQTRSPTLRLTEKDMAARKTALLWETVGKGGSVALFGNWVFLPWKGALIHLLPKDMYQELRSNRNRYKISEEEQRQLRKAVIAVAGLSAGGSIATTVAMEGIGYRFHLADFDHLEISNLNRLQASILDLNINKSYITARRLFEIDPYIEVEMFPEGVTTSNIDRFLKATFLFEECDSFDIKVVLRNKAKALRLPVVMLTSDSGLLDVERFDLEPTRPIFHGLVEGVDMEALARGDWQTKMAFVRRITDPERASNRMLVSLLEIQRSISTWPQLASDVVLGGSVGAHVAKKILLGTMKDSGRFYIDTNQSVFDSNPENILRQPATAKKGNLINSTVRPHDPYPSQRDLSAVVSTIVGSPKPMITSEQKLLTMLVRFAQAAPSGGNAQPWLFVHLRNLPEESTTGPRSSSSNSVGGPQQRLPFGLLACLNPEVKAIRSAPDRLPDFVALGASVENMVIALQGSGLKMMVEWFDNLPGWIQSTASGVAPSLRQPAGKVDPLRSCGALLTFTRASEPTDPLSDAIPHRVANRNFLGSATPLKVEQMKALQDSLADVQKQLARGPSLSLTIRPNDLENKEALQCMAQVHGQAGRLRFLSPTMWEDMQDEFRWTEEEAAKRRDGIDIPSLQIPEGGDLPLYALKERSGMDVLRSINNGGSAFADLSGLPLFRSSGIGMLSCSSKDRAAMFASGRAVQRLWLTVTSMKLGFQPMYASIMVLDFYKTRMNAKTPERELIDEQGIQKLEFLQQKFAGPAAEGHPHPVFIFAITDAPGPAQKSYRRAVSSCLKMPGLQ